MLASTLIRQFISTPMFLRAYCDAYGGSPEALPAAGAASPTRGHADNMGRTLLEWATRLDDAHVQVHQEGALARFDSAAQAPAWGRPEGAVAARAKTAAFYAECLRRAVSARMAHTFQIPAAATQGAWVASHEALAAAKEFHAAAKAAKEFAADPGRPELVAEGKKLEGILGRAASMHQTACAEAVAAWTAAEGGPWLRQCATAEEVPVGPLVVGLEIWAGHATLTRVHANLDPQHGGGTYGFGRQPATGCLAACDAALSLREQGVILPETTRYVTPRLDPDALVAGMILSGRIPLPLLRTRQAIGVLGALAQLDSGMPLRNAWRPEFLPQSVGDHPLWGPLGNMCLGRPAAALDDLEAAIIHVLTSDAGTGPRAYANASVDHAAAMRVACEQTVGRFAVDGPIAHATGLPMTGGAWAACYSRAPIGVLEFQRSGVRAFTVAACRDLGPTGPVFITAMNAALSVQDPGGKWAGAAGITGSRGTSALSLRDVVDIARGQARILGIEGAGTARTTEAALR